MGCDRHPGDQLGDDYPHLPAADNWSYQAQLLHDAALGGAGHYPGPGLAGQRYPHGRRLVPAARRARRHSLACLWHYICFGIPILVGSRVQLPSGRS